ncbi:hypothetical protein [Paraburkholderia sp. C35]|uniref:hypothetical protein n=1 Tax=Paraburkholderia sp. C35 TaxID=2126993 RepID=UPI000D685E8A|nr:hypothetical protein [Paraburkholderia sp. C35]
MTQEQDVVAAKERVAGLKNSYMESLQRYAICGPKDGDGAKWAALECQKRGGAFFNYVEEFVGNSDLLGAHKSAMWAQGFAEDCAAILQSMPAHFEFLRCAFSWFPELKDISPLPGTTAFANMQRITVAYLGNPVVQKLRDDLTAAGLPIYGFEHEAKNPMSKQTSIILAFIFGIVFVTFILLIAIFKPNPSDFQFKVFWAVMAMAVAGIAAVIPGFIEVKISRWVLAGGALAVFVMVYFFTPANQPGQREGTGPEASANTKN